MIHIPRPGLRVICLGGDELKVIGTIILSSMILLFNEIPGIENKPLRTTNYTFIY